MIAVMLLATGWISAQPCSIQFSGKVVTETGEPLIGATLQLNKTFTVADTEGEFSFNNLCAGEFTLSIQFVGYQTKTVKLTLSKSLQQSYRLTTDVTQLQEVIVQDQIQGIEHANNFAVLTEKQLAAMAGKTLGESVKELAGVNTIQAGPGIFKPVIHGVHSQRILILNYGIRQEGQQWGAEHAPEIDPMMASNIVVIKDASAIKYGTDALGGVIIVNPAPLPERSGLGGSINTILQSNGRSGTLSGMLEGGIKNHSGWGWRIQGTAKRAGDFHTPDYSLTNTGVKELNFSTAIGYHSENKGFEVFVSHFSTEIGILKGTSIGNLNDLISALEREPPQYTTDFSYKISEPRQAVNHNLLKLNGHIQTNRGELSFQYGFQSNSRKEFDIRIGGRSKLPAIDLQLNTHTVEAEWETSKSEKQTTCVGITGMYQDNNNIPGTQRIPFIPNFNSTSAGLFSVSKFFFRNLTLDAGARYDYRYYRVAGYDFKNNLYKSNLQFNNASATLGGTLQLKPGQIISTSISSAWRPPHVAELYSLGAHQSAAAVEYGLLLNDSTNEVMPIEDARFQNEQAIKWVTSYQRTTKSFTWEATGYVNYIFNYIYLRPTGITQNIRGVFPYFRYTQTDALFLGADFSATWQVNTHWKVLPRASLLRVSDLKNNDYLLNMPANRYELAIRYEDPEVLALKNFYVESKLKFTAEQKRAPRTVTVRQIQEAAEQGPDPFENDNRNFDFMDAPQDYFLLNFAAGFSVDRANTKYDFRIASENILNTSYREYTNRFRYYANELGRNIIVSLKCKF
jgi:iron complex outermembrane recepter protein